MDGAGGRSPKVSSRPYNGCLSNGDDVRNGTFPSEVLSVTIPVASLDVLLQGSRVARCESSRLIMDQYLTMVGKGYSLSLPARVELDPVRGMAGDVLHSYDMENDVKDKDQDPRKSCRKRGLTVD